MTENDENDVSVLDYGAPSPLPFQHFWKYGIVCSVLAEVLVWSVCGWVFTHPGIIANGFWFVAYPGLPGIVVLGMAIACACNWAGGYSKRAMIGFVVILVLTASQVVVCYMMLNMRI